jgi:hypothetical protein
LYDDTIAAGGYALKGDVVQDSFVLSLGNFGERERRKKEKEREGKW